MMKWLASLFTPGEPTLSEASSRDAAAIASLHAASFRRGWSEQEVEGLLTDRHVIAHRATAGARLTGFIMSRLVEDEEYQLRDERVAGVDIAKAKADVCTRLPPREGGARRRSRVEEVPATVPAVAFVIIIGTRNGLTRPAPFSM